MAHADRAGLAGDSERNRAGNKQLEAFRDARSGGVARVLERAVGARATNALGERIFRRNKGPELALSRARRSTTIPAQPIADHTTLF